MLKRITFSLLLLASCSAPAGSENAGKGGNDLQAGGKDKPAVGSAGGPAVDPTKPPPGEAGAANDPCAAIDVLPDGQCDQAVMCDPDCLGGSPDPSDDPCSLVRLAPDGQCDLGGQYAACDPDCGEPIDDPCAAVDYAPDGQCNPENICDPDCLGDPPATDPGGPPQGEAGAANDPCALIFIIPDGKCEDGPYAECDPDCLRK
jgi:hypothetical protein